MRFIYLIAGLLFNCIVFSQDVNVLLKEAYNYELKFNEADALAKYKEVLLVEPNHIKALQRAAELSCSLGSKQANEKDKRLFYETGLAFANRLYKADSTNTNSFCLLAIASGKMTEVESDNKKKVAFVRDVKVFADKALNINPNNALANYIEGKWHYEMLVLNWAKRLAVKAFYGGLPDPSMEKCIEYLEKSKKLDPYSAVTYLTLAKAYKEDNKAVETIETLKLLVKLPKRSLEDAACIEEGKKWLADEQ